VNGGEQAGAAKVQQAWRAHVSRAVLAARRQTVGLIESARAEKQEAQQRAAKVLSLRALLVQEYKY
jgi:hypothetical protein